VWVDEGLALLSGEMLLRGMAVELFRPRCELFGDLVVEEKDALRLKPDDVLDVVELSVDSLCVVGDPLLVLGLVADLVDVDVLLPPNMLPPLNKPPFEDAVVRCIPAQRFGPGGRLSMNRGLGPSTDCPKVWISSQ
jgi:hypothetical protein